MILIGLRYLHSNDIIHINLKPEKILLDIQESGLKIPIICGFIFS